MGTILLVLAVIALLLGCIELLRSKAQSLIAWAVVALAVIEFIRYFG